MSKRKPQTEFPRPGDWVEVRSVRGGRGQVVQVDRRRKRGRVRINHQEWDLPLSDMVPAEAPEPTPAPTGSVSQQISGPTVHEIDLHGLRVEEAIPLAQKGLDQALVAGLGCFKIIHGHGSGRLRASIRDMLASHPNVQNFHFGDPIEGGLACTVAVLHYSRAPKR